jgi:hypothetical protein
MEFIFETIPLLPDLMGTSSDDAENSLKSVYIEKLVVKTIDFYIA